MFSPIITVILNNDLTVNLANHVGFYMRKARDSKLGICSRGLKYA